MADNLISTFRRRFKVGKFTVDFTADLVGDKAINLRMVWTPSFPGGLEEPLYTVYRTRRNAAYAALAARLGGPAVMMDMDGTLSIVHPDGRVEVIDLTRLA